MTLVAEEVYLATSGRQQPWTNASLRRLLYFERIRKTRAPMRRLSAMSDGSYCSL